MPKGCFIQNCNTGYSSQRKEFKAFGLTNPPLFSVPLDPKRLHQWNNEIPNEDRCLTPDDYVCALHFTDECIEHFKKPIFPGDTPVKRKSPVLKTGAVPSIFPNCVTYLSTPLKTRKPKGKTNGTLPSTTKKSTIDVDPGLNIKEEPAMAYQDVMAVGSVLDVVTSPASSVPQTHQLSAKEELQVDPGEAIKVEPVMADQEILAVDPLGNVAISAASSAPQTYWLSAEEEPNLPQGVEPGVAIKMEPVVADQDMMAGVPLGDVATSLASLVPQPRWLPAKEEPNLTKALHDWEYEDSLSLQLHIDDDGTFGSGDEDFADDACLRRMSSDEDEVEDLAFMLPESDQEGSTSLSDSSIWDPQPGPSAKTMMDENSNSDEYTASSSRKRRMPDDKSEKSKKKKRQTSEEAIQNQKKKGKRTAKPIDYNWGKQRKKLRKHCFVDPGTSVQLPFDENTTVLDIFLNFFTLEMIESIVAETNKYVFYVLNHPTPRMRNPDYMKKNWVPTDSNEMFIFLAITLAMPRVHKNSLKEYWSTNAVLSTPYFSQLMSRSRFEMLLRMIHLNDNDTIVPGDRLHRIRPIVTALRNAFKNAFRPKENLVIDESSLLFKGNLHFKQCIPSKRSRFGIKTFVLCDSLSGYVLDFIVYTGGQSDIEELDIEDTGKSGDIVFTLLSPYLEKGHTIFLDQWYTSPALFIWLFSRLTNACGTVRHNRKNMPKMAERLKVGEFTFRTSTTNNLYTMKWCSKSDVFMLSTYHEPTLTITERKRYKTDKNIMKPTCIHDYNKNMGAMDRSDMVISSIESIRKTCKWYKQLFFHLLDLSVLNAHTIYKMIKQKPKMPIATFHLQLIEEIVEKYGGDKKTPSGSRKKQENPLRLRARHFICKIPLELRRRCVVCAKKKLRRETRYWCEPCNAPLCTNPCFENYHTKKHY